MLYVTSSQENMSKYFQLARITFQEYFTYRLNFSIWRFRNFAFILTLVFFWLAVYGVKNNLFGYQKSQMLTYVIGIAFLRSVILSTRSVDLPGQIRTGQLTKLLLLPIGTFKFWMTRDLVDKIINISFSLIEIGIIVFLFGFPMYFPHTVVTYLYFLIAVALGFFLYFFLGFALSLTAFWTEDVWSTQWLVRLIFLEFLAGTLFPIDILPKNVANIIYLTPFPYLVFLPMKIWLEQLSFVSVLQTFGICIFWLFVFFFLARFLWEKGSKNYGAFGG